MSRSWIKAPRHVVMDTIPLMLLLVGAYDRSYLLKFKRLFSEIIVRNMSLLAKLKETYIEKARILNCELVFQLAFTDTSLLLLAQNSGGSILTRDRKLWAACKKSGVDVFHLDQVLSAGDLISPRG